MSSEAVKDELKQRLARAMLAMQKMQAKLESLEKARTEPIAIIGVGCRFPGGADTPEAYWKLLEAGRDVIRREPEARRVGPESSPPRWAGYLDDVSGFDAAFFGISPREASSLDPRQRMLLEVAWEALEHAGQDPERLVGTHTGVFVGLTGNDYERLLPTAPERIDPYFGTGNGHCFPPGRVSYTLGLQGPSLSVDTACSSSLVAVHLACQSLRSGESQLAIAGGANLVLDPFVTETLLKMHALSPNGRCSAFDARANGFVRGEGAGVVVLKRLSEAVAQGDNVLAVIRGSAVNQDGRSTGLTAPNVLAQQALLKQALQSAGVDAAAIDYVEAHGTGTSLGDPIEVEALVEVLGKPRADGSRCALASVKTNMGHLEAAAGIAGLIKVVLSLQHESIPRHLNFTRLNPRIRLEGSPFFVPTEQQPWKRGSRARLAGVSSFGMSGTNAHIILEEAPLPAAPARAQAPRPAHLLVLSARSKEALVDHARRHAEHLTAHPELAAEDVCFTTNTARARLPHRLAVAGSSREALITGLSAYASGSASEQLAQGREGTSAPKVAFLFTGQGSQFAGMGRRLYETSEVFRDALHRCAERLKPRMDLLSVLYPKDGAGSPIDQTAYSQPALLSLEWALAEVWRSWGVVPEAVMGHSVGEFAAACVAGVLSLEDALDLIAERGRLMQALPSGGVMATVFAPEPEVAPLLERYREQVSIAAYNAPGQVVISGAGEAVTRITAELETRGVASRRLNVSHAFHSPLLEPMLEPLEACAAKVARGEARLPLISNVTGRVVGANEVGAPGYWRRHARSPVRFQEGMEALQGLGIDAFVEVGPHTTLLGLGKACLGSGAAWLSSLRKGQDDLEQMLGTLGHLFVRGAPLDWSKVDAEAGRRKVVLPRYPWQRRKYWLPSDSSVSVKSPRSSPAMPAVGAGARGEAYQVEWQPTARLTPGVTPSRGTWLLLCDGGGVGERLAARLEAQGTSCVKVYAGTAPRPEVLAIAPTDGAALERLWRDHFTADVPCGGVVYLWGLDVVGVEGAGIREACAGLAGLARALEGSPDPGGRLWVVTRGTQLPAVVEAAKVEPAQAPLWGLGLVAALEHPGRWGGLIDLDPEGGGEELLWEELHAASNEDQVSLRAGQRYVARLVARPPPEERAVQVAPEATYLITGGQGELGLHVARWLARLGARHLVLTARTPFPERTQWEALVAQGGAQAARITTVRELEAAGTTVVLARADVARREEMAALLEQVRTTLPPLRGIVHAAGVATHARLRDLDLASLDKVLAPKVEGAWNLHTLTQADTLDFFALFSSVSSVWGSVGVGHYAAANAFLDTLASHRRSRGQVASSINWGPWTGQGVLSTEDRGWLEAMGVEALAPEPALDWLGRLLGAQVRQAAVASVRWDRFKAVFEARHRHPLLERIGGAKPEPEVAGAPKPAPATWRDAPTPAARRQALQSLAQESVAHVLGLEGERSIPPRRGFTELGMDSIMAVELKDRLQSALGKTLPATLAFNFPDLQSLTDHLTSLVEEESAQAAATSDAGSAVDPDEPIAIVGMSCRFPGGVDSPEAFWRLLREGGDAISEVPGDRWDLSAWYDPDPEASGKMYVRAGGFLSDVSQFDPRFFGISPREAESMDPQQRLMLEVAWEALERAGQSPEALRNTKTGVFVGISHSDYARLILEGGATAVDAWFASGTELNVTPGRIAYTLGLQGPALAVDTACSSSLVALHLACQSLRRGESTMALAGGVNLMLSPEPMVAGCRARMLAPDGRCKTFDASANGYARAEGAGVLVLERLSDALAKGRPVLAVIRGSAVNQDGPSSGLTVPNGLAQQAVIREALRSARVSPSEVSYLEAHGTGTSLGDPIEVESAWAVLKEGRPENESLWLGSVKTNVGHMESAAGMAGVMKVVLAMQHKHLPAHLHFKSPNPHIPWGSMRVKVPGELTSWEPEQGPRLAGVSSFGFSGTNAHVVLEEAPVRPSQTQQDERPVHVLVLSARSAEALRALAGRYAEALGEQELAPGDVCFTAAVGRAHLEHRLAVVGDGTSELKERLAAVAEGRQVEGVVEGRVTGSPRKVGFVFGGEEAWRSGTGRELYARQPLFREALEQCAEALRGVLERPLVQVLYGTESALLKQEEYKRAAVFSQQWALARLWQSWGVEPHAVAGQGVGEYVAACVAGVFGLEEALRRVVGKPGKDESLVAPRLLWVSGQNGQPVGEEGRRPDFWRQPRATVLAGSAIRKALQGQGVDVCLAVGPCVEGTPVPGQDVHSVQQGRGEWEQLLEALGALYVKGVTVDWEAYDAPYGRQRLPLPTYPFQRQQHWLSRAPARKALAQASSEEVGVKPHLGKRLRSPALSATVYETTCGVARQPHLRDHRLFDTLVVAGSTHVSRVLSAMEELHGSPACTLENLLFPQALVLAEGEERPLQVILQEQESKGSFEVRTLGEGEGSQGWVLHATGELRVGAGHGGPLEPLPSREDFLARSTERRSGEDFYRTLKGLGYALGPSFAWIGSLARHGNEILGEMGLPTLPDSGADYALYPGLLDSCWQVLAGWMFGGEQPLMDALFIPFSVSRFTFHRPPRGTVWCHARVESGGQQLALGDMLSGDMRIYDAQGPVADVQGFRGRLASRDVLRRGTHARREGALYEIGWQPESPPSPVSVPVVDGRPWLLWMDARGVGERLGRMLEEQGAPVVRVRPGSRFQGLGERVFELDAHQPEDFSRLLAEGAGPRGYAGVVYLWGLDNEVALGASAEDAQRAVRESCGGALHLVQALAKRDGAAPLWLVTGGAQAVGEKAPLALAQTPLWGFGRTVDLEHPELRCTRVDLDPANLEASVRLLHAELGRAGSSEREVAFRGDARLRPVLRRESGAQGRPVAVRADGTYLLTGGLGGLGLEVARWLVEQGARHLVLMSRREPSASAAEVVRALERQGASIIVASADVAREADVVRLLQEVERTALPLRGIIHAAGVLDDGALVQQDVSRFERVLAPKVAGAWNLHRLTVDQPLDFFVLFSSGSAVLGSPGQAGYAAANAFLDGLAHERRAQGRVAHALDWGAWAEVGMVSAGGEQVARQLERRGIRALTTHEALALLGEALARSRPQLALLSVQWPVYLESLGAPKRSSFYAALAPAMPMRPSGIQQAVAHPLAERLQTALPHERVEVLTQSLQKEVMRILRLDSPAGIDWQQGFLELGMDSLMAIELRNALQKGLGRSIPATVALDHPTVDFLAKHLLENVLKLESAEAPPAPPPKASPSAVGQPPGEEALDALSDEELARLVAEDLAKES